MKPYAIIFSMIILTLFLSRSLYAVEKNIDSVDLRVLEERVKQNEEKTTILLDAYQNKADLRFQKVDSDLTWQRNIAGIAIMFISFFGLTYIRNFMRVRMKNEAGKAISKMLEELNCQGKSDAQKIYSSQRQEAAEAVDKLTAEARIRTLKGAMAKFSKAPDDYSFYEWFFDGVVEYEQKEYQNAIDSWEQAIKMSPDTAKTYCNLGDAYCLKAQHEQSREDLNKALDALNKAIDLDSNDAMAFFNRAKVYKEKKKFARAHDDLNSAIRLSGMDSKAFRERGDLFLYQGRAKDALADLNKAIEISPNDDEAYNIRANAYINLACFVEAIEDYETAIGLNGKAVQPYKNLVELLIVRGDCERAVKKITDAKELLSDGEDEDSAILSYLECIALSLLKRDTTTAESEFNRTISKRFTTTWSFEEINTWLQKSTIAEATKQYIVDKTEQLRMHQSQI